MNRWRYKSNSALTSETRWNRKIYSFLLVVALLRLCMNRKPQDLNITLFLRLCFKFFTIKSRRSNCLFEKSHIHCCWIRCSPCSWTLLFNRTPAHWKKKTSSIYLGGVSDVAGVPNWGTGKSNAIGNTLSRCF